MHIVSKCILRFEIAPSLRAAANFTRESEAISKTRRGDCFVGHIVNNGLLAMTYNWDSNVLFSLVNKPFPVYSEAVGEHIQFLQGKIPISISSDKPSEVSRWLLGQLDFKIMAPDLSSQGVMLQGARVCDIKGKKSIRK